MVINRGIGEMTRLFLVVGTCDLSFLKTHWEGLVVLLDFMRCTYAQWTILHSSDHTIIPGFEMFPLYNLFFFF